MALGHCSGQPVCPCYLGNRLSVQDAVIFSKGRNRWRDFLGYMHESMNGD